MKTTGRFLRVEWAVLAFCVWQAGDLPTAWRHSPFDAWGWLALLIWLAPAVAACARTPLAAHGTGGLFCWAGLAAALGGIVTEVHFLGHCALALACAGATVRFRFFLVWLALSAAWMPALGYALHNLPVWAVAALRLALAVTAAVVGFTGARRPACEIPA
jgi:hypothetical protein